MTIKNGIFTPRTDIPNAEGYLAFILLEPVCYVQDGEDSSGRSKVRVLTPQETVERAFNIAGSAMIMARARGLFVQVEE